MTLVKHGLPCPKCDSSDAFSLGDMQKDGGYCFSCHTSFAPDQVKGGDYTVPTEAEIERAKVEYTGPTPKGMTVAIKARGLSQETCNKFDISTVRQNGKEYHFFGYYDSEGQRFGCKGRLLPKEHSPKVDRVLNCTSSLKGRTELFGMNLFREGGKAITIVEGEYDAASHYELMTKKYPSYAAVVALGGTGANKKLEENYKYLNSFDKIVIAMDNDEAGRNAAKKIKSMFPVKAHVMSMDVGYKDANDYAKEGKRDKYISRWFEAKAPDLGAVAGTEEDWLEAAIEEPEAGIPLIFPEFSKITRGIRWGEVWVLGAGSGMGKTEFFKELAFGFIRDHNLKCGAVFLEEKHTRTMQCMIGKFANKRYYIEGGDPITEDERTSAVQFYTGKMFVDKDRKSTWDYVQKQMEYMVHALGCKVIFIDHLTAIAAGESKDVNEYLHKILEDMNHFATTHDVAILAISHLNRAQGKKFREGAIVSDTDFYGSGAIVQRANFVIGFNGDIHGEKFPHNQRQIMCIKDRNAGDGTGKSVMVKFTTDLTTEGSDGRLIEIDETIGEQE